ncbi:MAG: peptidylprolyl isomerase [Chloroflexi bacterium]|nr:MAG: peptidylprolyl isomerase [Chloroflexota bacterium]MBL1194407.1 peptidylprolyl isomerase [Chloroflexota bacterium]NOH11695.1 peptidylprolyl isomerase [Chloroflexota bacterium]
MSEKPAKVADNVVVSMEYTLTVEGDVVDSSKEAGPIEFLQGHANIIPGLESELYGLKVGDSKEVTVEPANGYGELDDEAFQEVARSEFPDEITPEIGMELQMRQGEQIIEATVVELGDEMIKLDFNHPLAGKTLNFSVKVADLREATQEEKDHGHVHSHGHHH